MKILANASQMKQIDGYSIDEIGIPSLVLMEKAALATALEIQKRFSADSSTSDRRMSAISESTIKNKILAVCGVGNNGGDGVAALRILKEWGYEGAVLLVGDEKKASEQMQVQLSIARNLNIPVFCYGNEPFSDEIHLNQKLEAEYTVIIDGLFGIGLSKPAAGVQRQVIEAVNHAVESGSCRVFAVDIPSGIHASNGRVMGCAIQAEVTVTFGVNKLGLVLYPGCEYAGEVITADIGFPQVSVEKAEVTSFHYEKEDVKELLPKRKKDSNKGTYGKVLVIGGSKNMAGACCFSAKAAYTIGAGLVKVMTEECNRTIVQTLLPEALLYTYEESTILEHRKEILRELEWAAVVVLGPGLGRKEAGKQLLELVLEYAKVPVVLDADGLNLLSEKGGLKEIISRENLILTPHLKEMERLTGDSIGKMKEDIVSYGRDSMKDAKGILVLKDSRTIVTDGERAYVNVSGNNGMAKGGSGDVLTGIIAGLLAQGMENFEAACLGTYLHGLAGNRVTEENSEYSLLASDLILGLKKELKD